MSNAELEIIGCTTYVCPNIKLIDTVCKSYILRTTHEPIPTRTIQEIKDLAKEYFKKTYHAPKYIGVASLLPAFVYIGCNLEGDGAWGKREVWKNNYISIRECAELFGKSEPTVRKWVLEITRELNIPMRE